MENKNVDLGFVTTPHGKVKLVKCIQFNEVDNRSTNLYLTEEDNVLITTHNSKLGVDQQMHLSKESYALLFLGAVHANKHFGINPEEILNKLLKDGMLGYSSYPSIKELYND